MHIIRITFLFSIDVSSVYFAIHFKVPNYNVIGGYLYLYLSFVFSYSISPDVELSSYCRHLYKQAPYAEVLSKSLNTVDLPSIGEAQNDILNSS